MDKNEKESASWYQAMTLSERVAARRALAAVKAPFDFNEELAARELAHWKSQEPFDNDAYFAERLALDEISEEELLELLGESPEDVRARFTETPRWLRELEAAYAGADAHDEEQASLPLPEEMLGKQTVGFLNLVTPLFNRSLARLREGIRRISEKYPASPFEPETIESLLVSNLPWQLYMMLSRTMVLELNIARIEGLLEGETPEARFEHFLSRLKDREVALNILREYPVLARQLITRLEKWESFSLEFLEHLASDWEEMKAAFSPEAEAGLVVAIGGGAGDSHRGGRSVMLVRFSSGLRVVYKPRSLAVDEHFQELLVWLNERGSHPSFRTLKILNRGSHGWVEFVLAHPCASLEEVQRFYRRQGGYLALLYALEATDLHYENLIAAGEHPVIIDLESLFHPRIRTVDIEQPDARLVSNATTYSVLRIGLLPYRTWAAKESEGVDLSGLGGEAGQLTPDRVLQWERAGTDEMHALRKQMLMPGSNNRPRLKDDDVNILDYAEEIAGGFSTIYSLLLKHRDELLASDGLLARFAEDEVRAIVRATRVYGMLLQESSHPDMQRDALELERFYDRLWLGRDENRFLPQVIPHERRDLLAGDIPMFTTQPATRDVWSSAGKRIPNFLSDTGLSLVEQRLRKFSEEDLSRQVWFIRASLATLTLSRDDLMKWPSYSPVAPARELEGEELRERLLKEARAVGDRLEALALRDDDDVAWIGLAYNNQQWGLVPLLEDLYGGACGLILSLAYLGEVTRVERYTTLAQIALKTLRRRLVNTKQAFTNIGAFNGLGSLLYALSHLSVLWRDASLLTEVEEFIERLPQLIEQDEDLDVVGGTAGCLCSLMSLHAAAPEERLRALAKLCGERLLAHATEMEEGIGWFTRIETSKPITGFSHGS
ncbi:MAG: type 2 lantipeptide synthetase LanM family protein, partial [Acidobacteria bacterium]|nr:type 2 lantipeptide synthetase LanM family protein [Acidobacteriota bacterium]